MALETQEEMALSCSGAHLAGWLKDMTAEMHKDARSSSGRMMGTVNGELFPEEDHIGMPIHLLRPTLSMHGAASSHSAQGRLWGPYASGWAMK